MPAVRRSRPSSQHIRVLVVDDHEDTRDIYTVYLRYRGFIVDAAADGVTALRKAVADPPDVIVLDLTMPGMSGHEVLSALRADSRFQRTIILVVTGHVFRDVEGRVRRSGANGFVKKPCPPEDLVAAIETQLTLRRRDL